MPPKKEDTTGQWAILVYTGVGLLALIVILAVVIYLSTGGNQPQLPEPQAKQEITAKPPQRKIHRDIREVKPANSKATYSAETVKASEHKNRLSAGRLNTRRLTVNRSSHTAAIEDRREDEEAKRRKWNSIANDEKALRNELKWNPDNKVIKEMLKPIEEKKLPAPPDGPGPDGKGPPEKKGQ